MFDIIEAKFCVNMLEIHFMTFCVMILNLYFFRFVSQVTYYNL